MDKDSILKLRRSLNLTQEEFSRKVRADPGNCGQGGDRRFQTLPSRNGPNREIKPRSKSKKKEGAKK